MNQPNLLALYGLKFNPFAQDIPVEAVFVPPKLDHFCWRSVTLLPQPGSPCTMAKPPSRAIPFSMRQQK